MSALRLARAFTRRDRVLKFAGGYHGHADPFLAEAGSGLATLGIPASPGVPAAVVADTIVVDYNDVDLAAAAVERHSEDLAAIFVEPVAGNMGCVPPAPGFLEALRALCDASGALLVFDEVITGFRVARGGAQERYGVRPDLTILGKIVGGGLPLAAFGGRGGDHVAPRAGRRRLPGRDALREPARDRRRALGAAPAPRPGRLRGARAPQRAARGGPRAVRPRPARRRDAHALRSGETEPVTRMQQLDTERYARALPPPARGGIYVAPSQYECLFPSLAHGDDEIDATIAAVRAFAA